MPWLCWIKVLAECRWGIWPHLLQTRCPWNLEPKLVDRSGPRAQSPTYMTQSSHRAGRHWRPETKRFYQLSWYRTWAADLDTPYSEISEFPYTYPHIHQSIINQPAFYSWLTISLFLMSSYGGPLQRPQRFDVSHTTHPNSCWSWACA